MVGMRLMRVITVEVDSRALRVAIEGAFPEGLPVGGDYPVRLWRDTFGHVKEIGRMLDDESRE